MATAPMVRPADGGRVRPESTRWAEAATRAAAGEGCVGRCLPCAYRPGLSSAKVDYGVMRRKGAIRVREPCRQVEKGVGDECGYRGRQAAGVCTVALSATSRPSGATGVPLIVAAVGSRRDVAGRKERGG